VGAPLADFSPDEESDCRILGPSATPDVSFMVEDGRVTTVRVGTEPGGSSAVRTPEGVGLGSSRTVVKAAYPSAVLEENIYGGERAFVWNADRSRGLRFDISEGRVTAMEAGTRSIEYVEGCL
jgi:hypothetical protein